MGESRTELLAWLNDLLRLNYTKVEQAGTGAAYCQIMDSIFNDVHMPKVKFETKHEYENVANFKILQHTFDKHKIDKIIPVDKLVKCKFQDNLEFMQWMKRFWDQNYQGEDHYDAAQRRKGTGVHSPGATRSPIGTATIAAGSAIKARKAIVNTNSPVRNTAAQQRIPTTGRPFTAKRANNGSNGIDKHSSAVIQDLNKQIMELKLTVDGLEKERDFYFNKLRGIEILVQEHLEIVDDEYSDSIQQIQEILYQTEDGFEVPPEDLLLAEGGNHVIDDDDDETF